MTAPTSATSPVRRTMTDLVDPSNRLGADPRATHYAGGNASAKGAGVDPVTGEPVELLWVKGSGGDLGLVAREAARTMIAHAMGGDTAYIASTTSLFARGQLRRRRRLPQLTWTVGGR